MNKIRESRENLGLKILQSIPNYMDEASLGIRRYTKYYDSFFWNEERRLMSDQKLVHTMNMTAKMMELSKNQNEQERLLYFWAGLLHDFGRAQDINRGTYKNSKHAQIGAELLFDYGLIHMFPIKPELFRSLRYAIELHGVNSLEQAIKERHLELTSFELKLCKDVRNADKWDIMEFLMEEPTKVTVGATEYEIAQLAVSTKTKEELLNHQTVRREEPSEEYTHMRHFLSHVGFIYDIDDIRLIKWIKDTKWVNKYLGKLTNPKDADSLEEIQRTANDFIEKATKDYSLLE